MTVVKTAIRLTPRRVALASVVFIIALVGFAHTKVARSVMSCPFGFDKTAEQLASRRKNLAALHATEPKSPSLKVFDFEPGSSARADIERWASEQGGACKRSGYDERVQCEGPFFGADDGTIWVEFDGQGRAATIRGIQSFSKLEAALKHFDHLRGLLKSARIPNLKEELPSQPTADLNAPLRQASVSATLRNLTVQVRITNMGQRFAVTHEYVTF